MRLGRNAVILIGLTALFAGATTVYTVLAPLAISKQYADRVQAVAEPLEENFKDISKSTELPLLTNLNAPEEVKEENLAYIEQLINEGRQRIGLLRAVNNSLVMPPYSDALGQYESAELLHSHTTRLIKQSEDALSGYLALLVYLKVYNEAADSIRDELDSFNSVVDINIYGGQSEAIRQVAAKLRANADILSKSSLPVGIEVLNVSTAATLNEAAAGFDDLANGLLIPADDPIYTAAHKIEDVTAKFDTVASKTYSDSIQQSRIIRNVQDLEEKLELIVSL